MVVALVRIDAVVCARATDVNRPDGHFTQRSHSGNGAEIASWAACRRPFTHTRKGTPVAYQAEYIWIDGTEPTPLLRSKTKILADGKKPPDLGLRRLVHQPGHRRRAATACSSPVFTCPDPIRGGDNILVLCEVVQRQGRQAAPHQHPRRLREGRRRSTPSTR